MELKSCGVLDTPLSRSMTVIVRSDATLNSDSVIPGSMRSLSLGAFVRPVSSPQSRPISHSRRGPSNGDVTIAALGPIDND
jgi:hypothetical protein